MDGIFGRGIPAVRQKMRGDSVATVQLSKEKIGSPFSAPGIQLRMAVGDKQNS
jgi:hypothetical protein